MENFQQLKKMRQQQTSALAEKLEALNKPAYKEEEGYWRCQVDKAGNGTAIIRFLPAPQGEDVPFVRYWAHGFKNPSSGRWYIEWSRTTLGEADPVSEYNSQLWNTGVKENQDIVRAQKRNLNFVSNIYVVKDPANPENEGKTFKFRYGKKIFDKLNAMMYPEQTALDDTPPTPINPFDFWEGANFRLIIRKVEGFTNYDSSKFDGKAPLLKDDVELEEVWKKLPSLSAIVAPSQFKGYDELKQKLYSVLGSGPMPVSAPAASAPATAPKVAAPKAPLSVDAGDTNGDADDDTMAMFKKLAAGIE